MLVLKDVLDLVWNRFHQGGKEFQPDKYLTDRIKWISMSFIFQLRCVFKQTILLQSINLPFLNIFIGY